MTLQNKNNQFLSAAQKDEPEDALDIFAQYGTDDTQTLPAPTSNHSDDGESVGNEDPVTDEQRAQEGGEEPVDLFEKFDDEHSVNDGQPKENAPQEQEMRTWEEKMKNGDSDSVVPSGLPVVNDHDEQNDDTVNAPEDPQRSDTQDIQETKKDIDDGDAVKDEMPQQEHEDEAPKIPITETLQAVEMEVTEEEKTPVVPVAPPMRENINAVVQSDSGQIKKKSFLPNEQRPAHAQPSIDPAKKTVAIVDDDLDTLDMYASIFESADYNVLRASDGLEALSVISEHTPHVIFTGIVMPRMDGFTMMEALKQNQRTADIPVVINSHLGRDADRKRAEELGARDFIVRGFTPPREALERIGALLLRSEYTFRFDVHDPEARKLVRDLGASNFFVCPRGQEMVIKLGVSDPKNLTFSARFSCVDEQKKK